MCMLRGKKQGMLGMQFDATDKLKSSLYALEHSIENNNGQTPTAAKNFLDALQEFRKNDNQRSDSMQFAREVAGNIFLDDLKLAADHVILEAQSASVMEKLLRKRARFGMAR
jgi:hypothetical protein